MKFFYQTMNNYLASRMSLHRQAQRMVRMLRGSMRREPVLANTSIEETEPIPIRSLQEQPYAAYAAGTAREYARLDSAPDRPYDADSLGQEVASTNPDTLLQEILAQRAPGAPTPREEWFAEQPQPDWSPIGSISHPEQTQQINDAVSNIAGPEMSWGHVSLPQPGMDGYSPRFDSFPTAAVVLDAAPTPDTGGAAQPFGSQPPPPALEDIVGQSGMEADDPMPAPEIMAPDPLMEPDPMLQGPMM